MTVKPSNDIRFEESETVNGRNSKTEGVSSVGSFIAGLEDRIESNINVKPVEEDPTAMHHVVRRKIIEPHHAREAAFAEAFGQQQQSNPAR